jgi:hypothetical protein
MRSLFAGKTHLAPPAVSQRGVQLFRGHYVSDILLISALDESHL